MLMISFTMAFISYLLGTTMYFVYIFNQNRQLHTIGTVLLGVGFFSHTVHFIAGYIMVGYFPVVNFRQALSMFAWAMAGSYLFSLLKFNMRALGSFISPLCTIAMIWSWALPDSVTYAKPIYKSVWLTLHVGTVFLGNGAFALAFVAAIMYLLQERHIKMKKQGFFFRRLPSLSTLDSLHNFCIMFGFPLLTVGIISGSIYAQIALGSYWSWDPKEVWSLISWLLYAVLVHQRITVGWRGRRAAIMSIIAFAVLVFSFSGINFLLKGYHSFETLEGPL